MITRKLSLLCNKHINVVRFPLINVLYTLAYCPIHFVLLTKGRYFIAQISHAFLLTCSICHLADLSRYGCARTEVDSEEVERQRSQTDACQASTHLGKRERDAGTSRDPKPGDSILCKLNAIVAAVSTSQAARSAARLSSQVLGTGGANETQCPSRQAKGSVHNIDASSAATLHITCCLLSWVF